MLKRIIKSIRKYLCFFNNRSNYSRDKVIYKKLFRNDDDLV